MALYPQCSVALSFEEMAARQAAVPPPDSPLLSCPPLPCGLQDLQQLPDGRMHVVARGQQRFQVVGVVEATPGAGASSAGSSSSPELVCTVQLLKEETSPKEAPEVRCMSGGAQIRGADVGGELLKRC